VIGQYHSDIHAIPQFNQSLCAIPTLTLTGLVSAKLHRNDVMLSLANIYL